MSADERTIPFEWVKAVAAFAGGFAVLFAGEGIATLGEPFAWACDKVGVTIFALAPLAVWCVWTAFQAGTRRDVTLAYIGATAQRVGLLGTVIGIVAATISIGDSLNAGAASAVTRALPAVGQALVSTAAGFVIAISCDLFRFLGGEDQALAPSTVNEARPESSGTGRLDKVKQAFSHVYRAARR